jgi:hypothetical protein
MLGRIAIRAHRPVEQVKMSAQFLLDRSNAACTIKLEARAVFGPNPYIRNQVTRAAMLDNQVGNPGDGKRVKLPHISTIVDGAGRQRYIEFKGFAL